MKKILAFFAVMAAVSAHSAFSQDITLTFTGARTDGAYVVLDSVQVQNITRSWTETVVYPDTVLSFPQSGSGIADVQGVAASLSAYPNPFNGVTNVAVAMPQSTNATVQVFNLAGQKVVEQTMALQAGNNLLEVRLQEPQVHILAVTTPQGRSTIKLINSRQGSENAVLSRGSGVVANKMQSAQPFQIGDTLRITGFTSQLSIISQSRVLLQCLNASENITLLFDTIPERGILPGSFSVSADQEVHFAKGNLQYTATGTHVVAGGGTAPGTWRFAPHQWDTIGAANTNISSSYTGWIDLFGWGTSGYHNTNDPYNTFYQPYSTGYYTTVVNATFNNYGYGPSTNMQDMNLIGTSANYDWGIYNAISNGGNEPERAANEMFTANAGNDTAILIGTNATLHAAQINEDVTYRWYDKQRNFKYEGLNYTVTPSETSEYILEVTAESDGYRDLDTVKVNVVPGCIHSITPNPVTDNWVEVSYEYATTVTSAHLHIYNTATTALVRDYDLSNFDNVSSVDIEVTTLPTGTYSLVLVCDNTVCHSKVLIRQ